MNDKVKVETTGNRYLFSSKEFPYFRKFAEELAEVDLDTEVKPQDHVPAFPIHRNSDFLDRFMHSYCYTVEEIYKLRFSSIERYLDLLV